MKKNYVYLIGGMEQVSVERMTGWRQQATLELAQSDIETLDPTRRGKFHDEVMDMNTCNRILNLDLQDIANSTVCLADMRYATPGKQWGSAMEIMFAHTKKKNIIVWTDEGDIVHPFVNAIATEQYHSLEECIDAVRYYFT